MIQPSAVTEPHEIASLSHNGGATPVSTSAVPQPHPRSQPRPGWLRAFLILGGLAVAALIVWQALTGAGNPNPLAPRTSSSAALLDIAVLVFREGLECVLVLAAVTAGMPGDRQSLLRPIALGVGGGFLATVLTWMGAVRVVDDLSHSVSALALQAATGLLAVLVLLLVMNWFFHKLYWTGWISMHNKQKRKLVQRAELEAAAGWGVFGGMVALGFTSLYREGFEVVLFLQSYRLQLGNRTVMWGALIGVALAGVVALLTFVAHRRLPYKRLLVLTGVLLGIVLIVMVGEQVQEMQLAHWIPATTIPWLAARIPGWMGLWLSVFPTVQSLAAQAVAIGLVMGSYFTASRRRTPTLPAPAPERARARRR
ncbi:MAG: FTR1 family protein [Terriglobales bacterium]